jgi:2-polyprenyl-3-methyl-5-hydroxy-6-metoxy-1,4-benzoquinol methylase
LLYSDCDDFEYFMPASFEFQRCSSCGLVFMEPLPTRDELPALYPAEYHNFEQPTSVLSRLLLDRYLARQAATCERYLPAEGAFLEVGCAGGDPLERLQRRHSRKVRGIDISRDACERAWERGLDVFHGTIDEFDTGEGFDMVFMSHVIEHVVDPVATMAKVASLLTPNGVLYLETPNVGALDARVWKSHWGLIHYPRHLYLFDRRTILMLVEGAGLDVEKTAWEINSCGWALSVQSLLRRRGIDRERRPRSFYYPFLLVALLPMNLVDLMTGGTAFMSLIARKPS